MATELLPLSIHWRPQLPEPTRVIIILEELGLPYVGLYIPRASLNTRKYLKINPFSKVPALHDPNTRLILPEASAIVQYLLETYDEDGLLTCNASPDKYQLLQWFHFQSAIYTPAIEALANFSYFQNTGVQSAKEHYTAEVRRCIGVLDRQLKRQEWLVGDKCTYVDLGFVAWNAVVGRLMAGRRWNPEHEFPHWWRWHMALMGRDSVRKSMGMKTIENVRGEDRRVRGTPELDSGTEFDSEEDDESDVEFVEIMDVEQMAIPAISIRAAIVETRDGKAWS